MLGRGARDPGAGDGLQRQDGTRRSLRDERRVAAWIGASIVIQGDVTSSEDMTVAGRVQGDVSAKEHTLTIAPGAHIAGNVVARAVAVHGRVEGTLTARQSVEIGETGSVRGDIVAPRMTVTEGGQLNGRLKIATTGAPTRS